MAHSVMEEQRRWGGAEGLLKNYEHPPALHSTMGWCSHLFIRHMDKFPPHRFQGIAGRSSFELGKNGETAEGGIIRLHISWNYRPSSGSI